MVEIMFTVFIIGILLSVAVPNFIQARRQAVRKSCISNLHKIDWAKDAYIMDNHLYLDAEPTPAQLYPDNGTGYLRSVPTCNSGGVYTINPGNQFPVCSNGATEQHIIGGD
ncbi:MAG: hypothetical protein H7Y38_20945 [Armatimonadetes bacterium]|nr:hypothetical protein [Armatimonadota bacterium]